MSPEHAREWVRKARADFMAAERALRDSQRHESQAEIACFHAQQCAEKYLKAILSHHGKPVYRIHDLLAVARLCAPLGMPSKRLERNLRLLNQYAVEIRYPGASANAADARRALTAMRAVVQASEKVLRASPLKGSLRERRSKRK